MGAMLTSSGEYVTTAVDSEAYRRGKKELPPFAPREPSPVKAPSEPIPDELLCPICKELMADAVVTPCCGNSYCDECIRSSLLDSEEHICFTCQQSDVSPDDLSANEALRQAVEHFKNGTCYSEDVGKQQHQAAPPPPRPQLLKTWGSRQQDPLAANMPPATSALPTALDLPAQPATAPPVDAQEIEPEPGLAPAPVVAPAPALEHDSPMHSACQSEPPPPGVTEPVPAVPLDSSAASDSGQQVSQDCTVTVTDHGPPSRPPHASGHQAQPQHTHPGRATRWDRPPRPGGQQPPPYLQTAVPPGPVGPPPILYPPPPLPFPPPCSGPGLYPPPAVGYPPQWVALHPPWVPPGAQLPPGPLPASLSQPPLSKENFSRQRHHHQDKHYGCRRSDPPQSHSRSCPRSPDRYRSRSPVGQKAPLPELPPHELEHQSGEISLRGPERFDRCRKRERKQRNRYSKHHKDPDSHDASLHQVKSRAEDAHNSATVKKDEGKSPTGWTALLETPPPSAWMLPLTHPSLHHDSEPKPDIQGMQDLPPQNGLPLVQHPPSSVDKRKRGGDDQSSTLGPRPGKLRRIDRTGSIPLQRVRFPSERPHLLPVPGSSDTGRADADGEPARPLTDLQEHFVMDVKTRITVLSLETMSRRLQRFYLGCWSCSAVWHLIGENHITCDKSSIFIRPHFQVQPGISTRDLA
ncbi:E3 ubiquitin-protein ligase RBBP6-like [Myripristis murdjan]|uniref:E3 ubiquitin-protein ligase RBBP6-like n=1 Tax=Myripristis murdjan TaxID=586833 RepID=UPI001175D237|nr:E3 ubiquitin-protein ligase RBBP6-like [Myripristis murdjan]